MLEYEIPSESSQLATIFELLEAQRDRLGLQDYSVYQTTIEQVR